MGSENIRDSNSTFSINNCETIMSWVIKKGHNCFTAENVLAARGVSDGWREWEGYPDITR